MLVRIVTAILTIVDQVLSYFVIDINTTTETGNETAISIATIIHYGTELYAKLLLLLVGGDTS